jgi:hypothetical protein
VIGVMPRWLSLSAALAGAALPAWQATRIDPTTVMRGE